MQVASASGALSSPGFTSNEDVLVLFVGVVCVWLFATICYYLLLYVIICHYLPLFVIICHYLYVSRYSHGCSLHDRPSNDLERPDGAHGKAIARKATAQTNNCCYGKKDFQMS